MKQRQVSFVQESEQGHDFGTLLKVLRVSKQVRQTTIVALLPGWSRTSYTRLENGELPPHFDQLYALYRAFHLAGIPFTLEARQQFLDFARTQINKKKTHLDKHSDTEWAELRYQLARLDGSASTLSEEPLQKSSVVHRPLLAETSHLLGREEWHDHLLSLLNIHEPKKVLIVRGPAGIGKSSEVNWLATYLFRQRLTSYRVILCDFRSLERGGGPEEAFEVFLGTLLTELGYVQPQTTLPSWEERTMLVLEQLEKGAHPTVILLDHSECILHASGLLAACWERFLTKFLRSKHLTTLVFATKQWPGWYEGEQQFVAEIPLPPLSIEKGVLVLQQLGLEHIPVSLLQDIYARTGGIPLCLEWVAALVKQPLFADDWEEFTTFTQDNERESQRTMTDAINRLLQEPHRFGGSVADELAPFLERILSTQRLSSDANALLQMLSVATLPLAKPALKVLCPQGSRPLKELRRASVLVAYPDRAQLLPMVAAAMYRRLSPEQIHAQETLLLQAYKVWQQDGTFHEQEEGKLIAEYATLLLKHRHILDAAQFLITYGWASVNLGYGPRLTRLVAEVMQGNEWRTTIEQECGGLLLRAFYAPFSGIPSDLKQSAREYQYVLDAILTEKITVRPWIEAHVVHSLMYCAMREERFADSLAILDAQQQRLKTRYASDANAHMFLQEKYALLFCKWGEYAHIQGETKRARELRMHAIDIYRTCIAFLTEQNQASPTKDFKRRLARCFNGLGYHLNYLGFYKEALSAIEQSIALKVQGYTTFTGLAESYGEKSQVLAALGKFQEALYFDEQAMAEIQRAADTGHSSSIEDLWIYRVNRGVLYLRLGRVEEAEQLLREASFHIQPGRRIYQMFAEDALNEIQEWRQQETTTSHYQLDWRWVERFRELAAYDGHGWLAFGGPFTPEEQEQWDHLFLPPVDAATWVQLSALLKQSRERELAEALAEQREPFLCYPAIDSIDVRRRLVAFRQLNDEIQDQEPNVIVRRLYQGAIEEEIDFLSLIEATHEGDSEKYWVCNLRLLPLPTHEEMEEVLVHIRQTLQQGLQRPETIELSQSIYAFMQTQFHLSLDLSSVDEEVKQQESLNVSQSQREVSVHTAQAFFESILQESGYQHWRVVIDPAASNFRVEHGMRQMFLPDRSYTVTEIRNALVHELAGHAARSRAGDHSPLGLLGINTKNALPTEEGLILYHERRIAALHGQMRDISGILMSTFTIGLATGTMTPPQTFQPICTFIESFSLLRRLLNHPEVAREKLQRLAKEYAIMVCLRSFRGVPDLRQTGICYLKDTVYLHGLHMIEHAVSHDEAVLDRLAVGVVALELLPDLQELGITSAPTSLWKLADSPDLDDYILSFASSEEEIKNKV